MSCRFAARHGIMTANEDEGGHWEYSRSSHDGHRGKGKRAVKLLVSQMAIKSSAATWPPSQKWASTNLAVEASSVTRGRAAKFELRLYVFHLSFLLPPLIAQILWLLRALDVLIESRYHLPTLGIGRR